MRENCLNLKKVDTRKSPMKKALFQGSPLSQCTTTFIFFFGLEFYGPGNTIKVILSQ